MKIKNIYTKCFDKFEREIFEGDFLYVQTDPIARKVYKKEDGQLFYFKPYDREDKVSAYFRNDMVKSDVNLNWIPYDGAFV